MRHSESLHLVNKAAREDLGALRTEKGLSRAGKVALRTEKGSSRAWKVAPHNGKTWRLWL